MSSSIRSAAMLLSALVLAGTAAAQDVLAIKDATIHTVAGEPIAKGTVLVVDGKITAVGPTDQVAIPEGARVIVATGKHLVPGLVVAHTYSGIDSPNENLPVAPFVSTLDSLDPSSLFFESQRREGVTTLGIFPGNEQPIGGKGVAVKIRADTVAGMLVSKEPLALKLSFAARGTRMQTMATIKKAFEDALEARKKHAEATTAAEEAKKKNPTAPAPVVPPIDFKVAPILDLLDGTLPCFVHADQPGDVSRLLELLATYPKLKATLVLGGSAFRAHADIAKAKLAVVLDPGLEHTELDPETLREALFPKASVLRKAGLDFALSPEHASQTLVTGHLWYQAAIAVKWGLPPADALKAITLWPARTIGLDGRLGTVEVGKDADLALLSGEPFKVRTFVERVWIDGQSKYRRDQDPWLERLYYKPPVR